MLCAAAAADPEVCFVILVILVMSFIYLFIYLD